MIRFKNIVTVLIAVMLVIGMLPMSAAAETGTETNNGADKPLITIGTISDPHTDYKLQNKKPYIRQAFITAMDALEKEGIDLLLVGGDITSDNQDGGGNLRWELDVYDRTVSQYQKYASKASKTGMTLWACGNHDHEVGRLKDGQFTTGDYNSYEGFVNMMLATCGYPVDLYVHEDDASGGMFPDHWLGAHYVINGVDFIIINPPYNQSTYYTTGTLSWLDRTLEKIGADKTVFITGHYPLYDSRNMTRNDDYGIKGDHYTNFMNVMNKYDNAIYLYGHNHGDGESVYISSDTFERVTHYDANGAVVNDRSVAPTSFITSFMGSAAYYKYSLNPDWLGADDPYIIQAMTITVYSNRIEFKMINCGKNEGENREPKIWTVMRDVKLSGEKADDAPILVTEEVNEDVYYGSALGIQKFKMQSKIQSLTASYHAIEAEGLDGLSFSVKRVYSGTKYTGYMRKLSKVVNDAVIFDYTVKKVNKNVKIETPVKVTLPALNYEFGEKTADLDIAAYYWNNDGKLCMTDVIVNEDGTYSFIMTNLSAFALSARANVVDQLTKLKTEKDGGDLDLTVVIIAVAAVVVAIAVVVTVILVVKKSKKSKKEDAKEETTDKEE